MKSSIPIGQELQIGPKAFRQGNKGPMKLSIPIGQEL
jgi:hypothetical protein